MDENLKKFKVLRNILVLCVIAVIFGSARLQILENSKYLRLSEENRIRQKFIPAPRGTIYDRYGTEIANTRPGFYVSIIKNITDQQTIDRLVEILDIEPPIVEERIALEKNPFMPVKIAHDISYQQLSVITEYMDKLKGVQVAVEPLRNYPYGYLFCHVVGYVGEITQQEIEQDTSYTLNDYIGRMGIEEYHEKHLKGVDGIEYVEVDARGREVGPIDEKRPIPFTQGKDLHTTVDCALSESVAVYLDEYSKAACVCMDPFTGEVLVLYSKPGFDPNMFVHGLKSQEWQLMNTALDAPMYNRGIMSCYPAGSTFKPFVALAALDAHVIEPDKVFSPCYGSYRLGNRVFRCWKKHGYKDLNGAIVHSCDVYFYQLGRCVGIDTLYSRVSMFGFGRITGIDLPNEKSGCLPDRAWYEKHYGPHWTAGHIFNLSVGQGDLLTTPLQLACAYAAIANNGYLVIPSLEKGRTSQPQKLKIDEEALLFVKNALRGVVEYGTARLANVPECDVCGKTGTAQNPHGDDHSIFIGFAPKDSARIVVCVYVENAGHGGSIAAPIVGKIINTYKQLRMQSPHAQKTEP